MMIKISEQLKALETEIVLGVLKADIKVSPSCNRLLDLLNLEVKRVEALTMENYKTASLEASRKVYRALGKDPTRYRISSDSLFRRIIKKKGIYYVNNVVDINNIISLKTLYSVGAYDMNKIEGDIQYTVGGDQTYEGIGRGIININSLPVLCDELGPFGSATSDSLRTMVTEKTSQVMMVIHGFGGQEMIMNALEEMKVYLADYAEGCNFEINLI